MGGLAPRSSKKPAQPPCDDRGTKAELDGQIIGLTSNGHGRRRSYVVNYCTPLRGEVESHLWGKEVYGYERHGV